MFNIFDACNKVNFLKTKLIIIIVKNFVYYYIVHVFFWVTFSD